MFEEIELGSEFFEGLVSVDEAIRVRVAEAGCRRVCRNTQAGGRRPASNRAARSGSRFRR